MNIKVIPEIILLNQLWLKNTKHRKYDNITYLLFLIPGIDKQITESEIEDRLYCRIYDVLCFLTRAN
jgi:hypothetical protein